MLTRRAGVDLKKKGTKFDAVYVSHRRRARQTCKIALTSPVLSVLWGGNLYPSALLSRTLSIVAPLALLATTLKVANLSINVDSPIFFGVILILGLATQGAIALFGGDKSSVESNHHSKRRHDRNTVVGILTYRNVLD
ncbi:hypothetical protein NDI47_26965 [Microcoleus vaginatus GB1-A2]|uniref:hypothetical protein n=1 Tax=Microcoleus vaginatus TaxID=119532 RepID=UPI0032A46F29